MDFLKLPKNNLLRTILLILLLKSKLGLAYSDYVTYYNTYNNVIVSVTSCSKTEEISKAFIAGELTQSLSKQLNYGEKIYYQFDIESPDIKFAPQLNITFENGYYFNKLGRSKPTKEKQLHIYFRVSIINISEVLRAVQYSINNISVIRNTFKLDSILINHQINLLNTPLIDSILNSKINPPRRHFKNGIVYFWQNDKFYVAFRNRKTIDSINIELKDIRFFERINKTSAIVFDSDSSFYYLNRTIVSNRQSIKTNILFGSCNTYYSLQIVQKDQKNVNFYFESIYKNELVGRELIYQKQQDKFIQNDIIKYDNFINKHTGRLHINSRISLLN